MKLPFKLMASLNNYAGRIVTIEGYTEGVGTDEYKQALSARRADSVRSYLVG